jgi:hypothetical protein
MIQIIIHSIGEANASDNGLQFRVLNDIPFLDVSEQVTDEQF